MKNNKISELAEKAKNLTTAPGTYLMKNSDGEIIYIGKAKNLRNRVSSYFVLSEHTPKTEKMVSNVCDFDIIITKSEYEALLLECKLIKKYSPKYNIMLKDDKGFSYINISKDDYPKISVSHNSGTLGPFITSYSITRIVSETNRIFKLRTCKTLKNKSCIYYEIGSCSAPCVGKISKEDYNHTVLDAIEFIKKGYAFEIDDMQKEMERLSDKLEFEKAAALRDRIFAIKKWKEVKIDNDVDNLVILEELREILKLKDLPRIIEAVDISNFGDTNIVGCVTAYKNGEKDKSNYRKYKVKTVLSQDDFGSMKEVVHRHFSHKETYPQIFFLDGPYREYDLPCPVFGLIKNDKHKFRGIDTGSCIIEDMSKELRNFLTRISDETHRFVINYMRKKIITEK
ncbi:MAG: GIY-YIG nuclease family protein [Ruminococcus sp.]|jgi:excinuclease UvrABC nuclease subunit|nr:GIY-YIG nuclease family protein [Ruminococcus sp.]